MTSKEPTTFRVIDINLRFTEKPPNSVIEDIVGILSDERYNIDTIIQKVQENHFVSDVDKKEERVTTDEQELGIQLTGIRRMRATYVIDEWYNKAHKTINCEACGREIQRISYSSHKNSRPCKAQQGRNKVESEGLSRVSVPTRKEIIEDELDGEIKEIATKHLDGNMNRSGKLVKHAFADKEKVKESKKRYITDARSQDRFLIEEETSNYFLLKNEKAQNYEVYEKTERTSDESLKRVAYKKDAFLYSADGYRIGKETNYSVEKFTQNFIIEDAINGRSKLKV